MVPHWNLVNAVVKPPRPSQEIWELISVEGDADTTHGYLRLLPAVDYFRWHQLDVNAAFINLKLKLPIRDMAPSMVCYA